MVGEAQTVLAHEPLGQIGIPRFKRRDDRHMFTNRALGPVPLPVGWVPRGRDTQLEQVILGRIRAALFL